MTKEVAGRRQQRLACRLLAGTILVTMLAGCETLSRGPAHTGSIGNSAIVTASDLTPEEAVEAVRRWGAAYTRKEKDKVVALNYAAALRAAGEPGQAVAVMRKSAIYHPEDREVLAAYGKALAASGKFQEALETVRRAQRADNPDWQLLSTEGGILDSVGRHEEARKRYRQALVLAPGEPQILNNFGLSYVLTNELEKAEEVLREAALSPRATLKMRQNLALVLSLRGKSAEASHITGTLDPDAAAEAAAVQGAVAPANTWEELAQEG